MPLLGFPGGTASADGAAGATGASGIFDYHAAGIAVGTARASNTITWGIQFLWNGEGTAPVISGANVLINAQATDKVYEVRLLLYTSATAATTVETVNVTTTAVGEASYAVAFSPVTLSAYRIYGISVYGAGETYYTTATFTYTTASGPGHIASIANTMPTIAVGAGGAAVVTVDHKLVNYGGTPPGVPQTALTLTSFNPIHPTFSNAS